MFTGLVSQSKILVQIKKIRNLVTAFETFESISASPGKGEISRLELQVSLMERAGSPHFACAADSKIVDCPSANGTLSAGVAAKTRPR